MSHITQQELDTFLVHAQEVVNIDFTRMFTHREPPKLKLKQGKRYAKIIVDDRSAFGFVDLTNGDVLKSASWSAPAKNFARGNVRDENHGTARIKWTGIA